MSTSRWARSASTPIVLCNLSSSSSGGGGGSRKVVQAKGDNDGKQGEVYTQHLQSATVDCSYLNLRQNTHTHTQPSVIGQPVKSSTKSLRKECVHPKLCFSR